MPSYTRIKRKMTDEQIVADFEACRDTLGVAMRAGVCTATVLDVLRRCGRGHLIARRGRGSAGCYRDIGMPETEVIRLYQSGEPGPAIARLARCPVGQIYNILERHGIERRPGVSEKAIMTRRQNAARRRQQKGDGSDGP